MLKSPTRTILVVDDDEKTLTALRNCLAGEGYRLVFARDPDEALGLLKGAQVDLILCEQVMPTMTGLDLLHTVRLRYPDIVRVMWTGHIDTETAIRALNHGQVFRLIIKPWDDQVVKMVLRSAFEQLDLERENRNLLAWARQAERIGHRRELLSAA